MPRKGRSLVVGIWMPASATSRSRMAGGFCLQLRIVRRLILRRRHAANRLEQPPRVEPVDPRQRREFDGLKMAPGPLQLDDFGLEEADDRFRQRIIVRVAPAADRWLDAGVAQSVRVAHGWWCKVGDCGHFEIAQGFPDDGAALAKVEDEHDQTVSTKTGGWCPAYCEHMRGVPLPPS